MRGISQLQLRQEAQAIVDDHSPVLSNASRGAALEDSLETALMSHFRDTGDRRAFELLYELTAPALVDWIGMRGASLGLRLDAHEILQDTFVNIYRYGGSFKGSGPLGFRRWARTIAANAWNRKRRQRALVFVEWGDGVWEVESECPDPGRAAEDQEQKEALQGAYLLILQWMPLALAQLSARDRYVLTAIHAHGASYREVENELELRPGGLKMIVHRARTRLRSRLQRIGMGLGSE